MYREVKTLENLVKIYHKIKERSLTPAELEKELSISHKTLYRCLSCLEGMGLIHKRDEDGRYEVVREWQEFKNESEYRVKLEHSRMLLGRIIDYVKGEESLLAPSMSDYVNEYLLQHIKSGYPDIYEQYCDWMEKNDEKHRDEAYFNYRKSVEWLALKVIHGEPLKGVCDICPKTTIGRGKP